MVFELSENEEKALRILKKKSYDDIDELLLMLVANKNAKRKEDFCFDDWFPKKNLRLAIYFYLRYLAKVKHYELRRPKNYQLEWSHYWVFEDYLLEKIRNIKGQLELLNIVEDNYSIDEAVEYFCSKIKETEGWEEVVEMINDINLSEIDEELEEYRVNLVKDEEIKTEFRVVEAKFGKQTMEDMIKEHLISIGFKGRITASNIPLLPTAKLIREKNHPEITLASEQKRKDNSFYQTMRNMDKKNITIE